MDYVFAPPPIVPVPVLGTSQMFAVHRIYCVGRNYVEHAQEMGFTGREAPFFFCKPADAVVVAPSGGIGRFPYPAASHNVHHEVELVVAIGRGGANIPAARALEHVFGYAVGLDMTRRDLQTDAKKQGRPWDTGKAFDHSAPIGPITPADGVDLTGASIALTVNDVVRQSSTVDKLIWSVAEVIEHLSGLFTLQAGDLIFTGTPEGVAAVQRGDRMHAAVRGLTPIDLQVV